VNRVSFLNNRYHHETSSVDYLHKYIKKHYKFLKFVCLIMQIRHYYAQFCNIFGGTSQVQNNFFILVTHKMKKKFRGISGYMVSLPRKSKYTVHSLKNIVFWLYFLY